ncbi:unnamed protein product [Caenorhabditis angaria]|uniref:Uncharacterized protein n=1 Tax=Caenorhabditis angaria TaxID=860376 RepID=A0A9P1MVC3_9PELO|nr:unnamed protein product [Caenorhabditis angaria]
MFLSIFSIFLLSIPQIHSINTIPAVHGQPLINLAERLIHSIINYDLVGTLNLITQPFHILNAQNQRLHHNDEMEELFNLIHHQNSIAIVLRVCDGKTKGNRLNKQEKEFDIKTSAAQFKLLTLLQNKSYKFFALKNETGRANHTRCYENPQQRNLFGSSH